MEPRALYDRACAHCHGVSGQGDYYAPDFHPPAIAGEQAAMVALVLRQPGAHDPVFPVASLPDTALAQLGAYVQGSLAHPPEPPGRIGPRALDPFALGVLVWGALALLVRAMSWLFAEGRS